MAGWGLVHRRGAALLYSVPLASFVCATVRRKVNFASNLRCNSNPIDLMDNDGEVQRLAYLTIVGRVDQFLWGMLFGILVSGRGLSALGGKHAVWFAAAVLIGFVGFWHAFNGWGGYYNFPTYPSPSPLWIAIPSIEGFAYAFLIAWYSESNVKLPRWLDSVLAVAGAVSFSIYIWHWPLRLPIGSLFDWMGFNRASFLSASLLAVAFFCLMIIVGMTSYRLVEKPFLSMRRSYLRDPTGGGSTAEQPKTTLA